MLFYHLSTAFFAVAFAIAETRLENPKLLKLPYAAPTAVPDAAPTARDDAADPHATRFATPPTTPPVFVDDDGNVTHTCDEFRTLLRRRPRDVEIRRGGLPRRPAGRATASAGRGCGRGQSECKLHALHVSRRRDRNVRAAAGSKAYDCTLAEGIFLLLPAVAYAAPASGRGAGRGAVEELADTVIDSQTRRTRPPRSSSPWRTSPVAEPTGLLLLLLLWVCE